jgi:uncharacterized membrane protein YfcA
MNIANTWYWLVLIGVFAGMLGGSLGVGGGIILVPALVLLLEADQKVAQGTSLAVIVPMALMAATRYHFNKDISLNWMVIAILVPCVVVGANIGSTIAANVPSSVLRKAFGALLLVVGARMIWKG